MYLRILFLLIIPVSFFLSCQPNQSENPKLDGLKAYYYPVNELEDGLVYVYENTTLNNQPEYWLHKTVYDEAGNQFLVSSKYNLLFNQTYMIREWIVADGSLIKDYRIFQQDSATDKSIISTATINQNVRYPFKAVKADSLAYRFNLDFKILPDTSTEYKITIDRRFDKGLKYFWEGDSLDAVQFSCTEYRSMQNNTAGGAWDETSKSVEIYVKGIGLVYKDSDSKAFPYQNILKKRISMDEFLALQKNQ
jgi:hypothetical protein